MADMTEEQMEDLTNQSEYYQGYPTPATKESLFKFFRELLQSKDSSKFGNVTGTELGLPEITVRGYQGIAIDLEEGWGMNKMGDYLRLRGESVLATSLSRKGFLAQLFVTQIKKEQKVKEGQVNQSRGLFGFGKKKEEGVQQ